MHKHAKIAWKNWQPRKNFRPQLPIGIPRAPTWCIPSWCRGCTAIFLLPRAAAQSHYIKALRRTHQTSEPRRPSLRALLLSRSRSTALCRSAEFNQSSVSSCEGFSEQCCSELLYSKFERASRPSERNSKSETIAMRCGLLVLVALLRVQALRTEPLELAARQRPLPAVLRKQEASADSQLTQPDDDVAQMQDSLLNRAASADEAFGRMFPDMDGNLDDFEYPDVEQFKSIEQLDDVQMARLSSHLLRMLQRPDMYEAPVILIKDSLNDLDDGSSPSELEDLKSVAKRTRYYRRYPWKRQNSRAYQSSNYDPYNPCTLTRKDVFKLLVALHDARQGNKARTVNFCNRKRPASAVYTNIRFLGRRRK